MEHLRFHAECTRCLIDGQLKKTDSVHDEELRGRFALEMCRKLGALDLQRDAAPVLNGEFVRLSREMLGISEDYSEIKHSYNQLLMRSLPALRKQVEGSADPLCTALQLSMAGNYIDFGVLKDVNEVRLLELLEEAANKPIDRTEYNCLIRDLNSEGELMFIHDNCGEIVLDRLLIETIQKMYPHKHICCIVRETPILNDVTIDDARETGLTDLCEVIGNGVDDMGGTPLHMIPATLLRRLENAPVIIAKGQGNFETMLESGLNVYFLFLAKCEYYTRWYGFERFSAILANDRRLSFQ